MTDRAEPSPWEHRTPVPAVGRAGGDVTLVEGQTFCISDACGDVTASLPHGLFLLDSRVLSRFELRLNGHRLERVVVSEEEPFAATFATRGAPAAGTADADLVVFRRRHVGRGMRERIAVTNHGLAELPVVLELFVDADFADLFEVKESRVRARPGREHRFDAQHLEIRHGTGPSARAVRLELSEPADAEPGLTRWSVVLAPGQTWEVCLVATVSIGDQAIEPRFRCDGVDEDSAPARELASWRARLPHVSSDHPDLERAVRAAGEDLGSLRIFDPEHPDLPIVAAGAPWFMTVFGRDSLLTAWMTLVADPSLAHGVLETLARFQGTDVDDETEEEPGKILHEMRFASSTGLALGGGRTYYGSIDATPLFVMLLGEVQRWGLADDLVARLLPHAHRALEWIDGFGDRDGDGYVEYQRRNPAGLANQGWKDSWDAVRHADGELARGPIALCEVQGYVYAAFLAAAHFAREAGDTATYERYRAKAADLRTRFNEDFWLEEHGTYALALDGDKRPIAAVASNVGHCLWTGIVDPERAPLVADRLLAPELFCGWGVRTLASSMAAYNPVSYHNGSVWPHDNAIAAAGLVRYGLLEHAHRILDGQLAAARAHGGRLPELFAGFARHQLAVPGSYPAACSPQAWSSAAPLLWLRTLLRFDPWMPERRVWVDPALPPWMRRLRVEGIALGPARLDVDVVDGRVEVRSSGPAVEVVRGPRPPLTSILA